ncbi:MAG: DNA polymerase III subunit beta [Candidatus Porifericomitaceae bacterium WSBS_2022_MAG_OTU9]
MEFNISSSLLQKTLQKAVLLVDDSKKDTVLSHVLVHGDGDNISLTVNGFDAEVQYTLQCSSGGNFERTFPAKKTNDVCKTLPPDGDILINLDDEKVSKIRCGNSNFTLSTIDSSEFPSLHKQEIISDTSVTVDYDGFYELIARTSFSMAVADVRPMLNGLLFDFGKNSLNMVATDGHRLAFCKKKISFSKERMQIILPRKIVERLDRIFSRDNGDISLHASERHIRMEQQGVSLICRLIEGQYPDYEKVIPKVGSGKCLLVGRSEMISSLVRVGSLVNSESTAAAKMKISDGKIHMSSRSVMGEEANDEIDVDYSGEDIEISFNISYLKDVLEKLPGTNIRFELRDSVSSFLVLAEDNDDQKYVIMPMRV